MTEIFTLRDEIAVRAPIERCFLLSTSVEIVEKELGMRPVGGRTSGLVRGGDTILWKGWQLGLPQFHQSLISAYEPYCFFQDTMLKGRFKSFQHDHRFEDREDDTVLLRDELRFSLAFGVAGRMFARSVMAPHIAGLLQRRFCLLKEIAEGEAWRGYLSDSGPVLG